VLFGKRQRRIELLVTEPVIGRPHVSNLSRRRLHVRTAQPAAAILAGARCGAPYL
jgi:hypothetical protein